MKKKCKIPNEYHGKFNIKKFSENKKKIPRKWNLLLKNPRKKKENPNNKKRKKKKMKLVIKRGNNLKNLKIVPVLIKYWLVTPGWSTSWIQEANKADNISNGVNTDCKVKVPLALLSLKSDQFYYL